MDRTLLQMTEIRLKNLERSKSLYEITAQKIVRSIPFLCADKEKRKKLKRLPAVLRENLLRKLTAYKSNYRENTQSRFEQLKAALKLLCTGVKSVELNGLMTFCLTLQELEKVVQIVRTSAPNIESFIINEISGIVYNMELTYLGLTASRKILNSVGQLVKLRKLEINRNINYKDLKKICRRLHNLQFVKVSSILCVCTDPFDVNDFQNSFCNLKALLFIFVKRVKTRDDLREFFCYQCIQHLPQLEILENYIEKEVHGPSCRRNLMSSKHNSALRQLCIYPGAQDLHQRFPGVCRLKLDFTGWDFDQHELESLLCFSRVKHLNLCLCEPAESAVITYRFLEKYGQKLLSLVLTNTSGRHIRLDLQSISNMCPKLRRLRIDEIDMVMAGSTFNELIELSWSPYRERRDICLLSILEAPKLEKITLDVAYFRLTDLNEAAALIAKRKILSQLYFIHIANVEYSQSGIPIRDNLPLFKAICCLIKNAAAFLPKLVHCRADILIIYNLYLYNNSPYFSPHNLAALKLIGDEELINILIPFNQRQNLFLT